MYRRVGGRSHHLPNRAPIDCGRISGPVRIGLHLGRPTGGIRGGHRSGYSFGGVGAAFWYGVVYLLFRKVAVHTDPGTGHIVLQRGWFGQQTKDFLTVGSEARIIVHPTNGDTPRKSQMGHDRVHALAFHAILFVDGSFIALPRDNHYHFADVLHFAKGFSHASGIPVQLWVEGLSRHIKGCWNIHPCRYLLSEPLLRVQFLEQKLSVFFAFIDEDKQAFSSPVEMAARH